MKTLPVALAAHRALGTTTLADLLLITREDAEVYAFTSHSYDLVVSGVTYEAAQGLDVSGIALAAALAVDNLELSTLDDGTLFTRQDVFSGRWRNAAFALSKCNWASVGDGVEPIISGTFGEVRMQRGVVVVELRDLKQYVQQPVGIAMSVQCRARLGDAACGKDLTSFTHTTTVTTAGQQVLTASGLAQAAGYFANGTIEFTTGECAGLRQTIKTHTTGGVLTLALPMLPAIANGDSITVVAGCRKRLSEDCYTKFNNVLRFQGEPHAPGVDALTKPP